MKDTQRVVPIVATPTSSIAVVLAPKLMMVFWMLLGSDPTTEPRPIPRADRPREMLEQALAAEKQAIVDYKKRLSQADAFGGIGLKVSLENQIADETRHGGRARTGSRGLGRALRAILSVGNLNSFIRPPCCVILARQSGPKCCEIHRPSALLGRNR